MTALKGNTTYTSRFIGNGETFEVPVFKRTAKTVTYSHPHTNEIRRAKIHQVGGNEYFFPLGYYSMAPIVKADNQV